MTGHSAEARTADGAGLGWYLYGVLDPAAERKDVAAGPSVDPDHEVMVLVEGRLAALASEVSLDEFNETVLPERLNDPAWLEAKIRAHEQVLEHALDKTAVVPFRFCTVYRSEAELRSFLAEKGQLLEDALASVRGKVERGVKAFADRDALSAGLGTRSDAVREQEQRVEAAQGGRKYMEERRLQQLLDDELARARSDYASSIHARLLEAAEDGVLNPPQSPELSGRDEQMLLNGAYLVPAAAGDFDAAFEALAREYGALGVTLELTGPWPPYNFVPRELGES